MWVTWFAPLYFSGILAFTFWDGILPAWLGSATRQPLVQPPARDVSAPPVLYPDLVAFPILTHAPPAPSSHSRTRAVPRDPLPDVNHSARTVQPAMSVIAVPSCLAARAAAGAPHAATLRGQTTARGATLSPPRRSRPGSGRRGVVSRVVRDPAEGGVDISRSIDMAHADELRREVVERDTATSLRKAMEVLPHSTMPHAEKQLSSLSL
jgi:hypothetical protein